jgi:hypothetical protein
MLERTPDESCIERAGIEREPVGIAEHEPDSVGGRVHTPSGALEQRRARVDADGLPAGSDRRRQFENEVAEAAADLDDSASGPQPEPVRVVHRAIVNAMKSIRIGEPP